MMLGNRQWMFTVLLAATAVKIFADENVTLKLDESEIQLVTCSAIDISKSNTILSIQMNNEAWRGEGGHTSRRIYLARDEKLQRRDGESRSHAVRGSLQNPVFLQTASRLTPENDLRYAGAQQTCSIYKTLGPEYSLNRSASVIRVKAKMFLCSVSTGGITTSLAIMARNGSGDFHISPVRMEHGNMSFDRNDVDSSPVLYLWDVSPNSASLMVVSAPEAERPCGSVKYFCRVTIQGKLKMYPFDENCVTKTTTPKADWIPTTDSPAPNQAGFGGSSEASSHTVPIVVAVVIVVCVAALVAVVAAFWYCRKKRRQRSGGSMNCEARQSMLSTTL